QAGPTGGPRPRKANDRCHPSVARIPHRSWQAPGGPEGTPQRFSRVEHPTEAPTQRGPGPSRWRSAPSRSSSHQPGHRLPGPVDRCGTLVRPPHHLPEVRMTGTRYDDLRALFVNCTLKRSPELSHTGGLIEISRTIMEKQGVGVEVIRAVDHDIATGVWPDMTEYGWASDEWPSLYREKVLPADILVIAGPIWLGDNSSVTRKVIERLYGNSHLLNDAGQYAYYGR